MKPAALLLSALLIAWASNAQVYAQELIIYPKQGQSKETMEKDKFDCYTWAKGQTGFDPMSPAPTTQPAPAANQGPQGERLAGAARGAVIGAVVGEIANDDAGKGAAAGAAAGVLAGGMKSRQKQRAQTADREQKAQQEAAANAKKRDQYNRAFGACLEGKGYTVK